MSEKNNMILISVTPEGAGTCTGSGNYNEGDTCTLSASANRGYSFNKWYGPGINSTSNPYSFVVTSTTQGMVEAQFNDYHVNIDTNVSPSGYGTVTGGGSYVPGDSCTLTATPSEGYIFNNWSEAQAVTLTWDGSTSGKAVFDGKYYKVSDQVPNCGIYPEEFDYNVAGETQEGFPIDSTTKYGAGNYLYAGRADNFGSGMDVVIYVLQDDEFDYNGTHYNLPKGTYFLNDSETYGILIYTCKLEIRCLTDKGSSNPYTFTVSNATSFTANFTSPPDYNIQLHNGLNNLFPKTKAANIVDKDTVLQEKLVSGTNIKTINGNSVLGSGDLQIDGGVTGVKGNNESSYRTGQVNITADNVITDSDREILLATPAEINTLSGITASTTELNYVHGVTSSIQTQLNDKNKKGTSGTITGNGTLTSFTVSHSFNTKDIIVQLYDLSTFETVITDVTRTDNSTITIEFKDAPANGKQYKVLLMPIV